VGSFLFVVRFSWFVFRYGFCGSRGVFARIFTPLDGKRYALPSFPPASRGEIKIVWLEVFFRSFPPLRSRGALPAWARGGKHASGNLLDSQAIFFLPSYPHTLLPSSAATPTLERSDSRSQIRLNHLGIFLHRVRFAQCDQLPKVQYRNAVT
jgi:hypothetical protein